MKKTAILILALSCCFANGQNNNDVKKDNSADSTGHKHKKKIYHEIGVNATYLIKQMFNSSGGYEIQPYQLTYKFIRKNWALRSGIGVNYSNTNSYNSSYSSSNYYGPDRDLPSFNKSYSIYERLGWEYRFRISRKLLTYTGIDIVGQSSTTDSQTEELSNNLPSNYYYNSQKTHMHSSTVGFGPVIGLQFYATSRFSIYAELPIYFLQTKQTTQQDEYSNFLNSTSAAYESSYSEIYKTANGKNVNISLPATIYFAIKF